MKKINKQLPKLKFKVERILELTQSQMSNVNAGEGTSLCTKPVTWDCVAPYNAPPFLTQKYCVD